MKVKTIFIVLMVILHFNMNARNQKMGDLYKYVIEDYYNKSLKEGYLSERDTMYLVWCFHDSVENCFNYDIQLNNDKIQFKIPKVDHNCTSASVCKLNIPEIEGQFIQISISPYQVTYMGMNENIGIFYSETITYIFKFDNKKSKYIFDSKKEYGL